MSAESIKRLPTSAFTGEPLLVARPERNGSGGSAEKLGRLIGCRRSSGVSRLEGVETGGELSVIDRCLFLVLEPGVGSEWEGLSRWVDDLGEVGVFKIKLLWSVVKEWEYLWEGE